MKLEIVGRDEACLHPRFIDDVREGPSAIVLEGDAGIGKSTLWLAGFRLPPAGCARDGECCRNCQRRDACGVLLLRSTFGPASPAATILPSPWSARALATSSPPKSVSTLPAVPKPAVRSPLLPAVLPPQPMVRRCEKDPSSGRHICGREPAPAPGRCFRAIPDLRLWSRAVARHACRVRRDARSVTAARSEAQRRRPRSTKR